MVDQATLRQFENNIRERRGEQPLAPIAPTQPKEKPMTTQLAAISPTELVSAQKGVLAHCANKVTAIQQELAEANTNLEKATRSKWSTKPFAARVNQLSRKLDYFNKIAAAVDKGYLIIPDVWSSNIFAIRVKDKEGVRWDDYGNARKRLLPVGAGEYIDAKPIEYTHQVTDDKGKTRTEVYDREADDEIDFPVSIVNPAVLEATEIAMADRIFDRFKIARQGGDPFILGEICNPTTQYKSVTFFVAWFLDVNTL